MFAQSCRVQAADKIMRDWICLVTGINLFSLCGRSPAEEKGEAKRERCFQFTVFKKVLAQKFGSVSLI